MQDLISRQAAIDALGKVADELYENIKKGATFPQRQWFDGMAHAQSILEDLPSAQPEIIRCKDCTWFDSPRVCLRHGRFVENSNWYCADGERRRG